MKRIAVVIGTRPEAIKMASVIAALKDSPDFQPVVINSGQHRELIDQVIDLFEIEVGHNLAVMEPDQSLAGLTSKLVAQCDDVFAEIEPDMVLVQGDTTTVFCAALAAFYRQIPVGHVEAGLRTGNIVSPFPEEANRRLTTALATLHFPPTDASAENLRREHVPAETIAVTGNTVIDALNMELARQQTPQVASAIRDRLTEIVGKDLSEESFVLITGHRRENFGTGFEKICQALLELANRFPSQRFVYPVHLNPRVKEIVHQRLGAVANVHLIPPQPYSEFVSLLSWCKLVLTDSGGVQEEAPGLGKPVLVMRDTTERPEGVAAGTVKLVGADTRAIVENVAKLLDDEAAYRAMAEAVNPYGDGHAAGRIVEAVRGFLVEQTPKL